AISVRRIARIRSSCASGRGNADLGSKVSGYMATFRELLNQTKAAIRGVDTAGAETRLGEATFLDVREPDEYSQGTIPGAIHIPRGQLETNIEGRITDRDAEVVIYCAGGTRSAFA